MHVVGAMIVGPVQLGVLMGVCVIAFSDAISKGILQSETEILVWQNWCQIWGYLVKNSIYVVTLFKRVKNGIKLQ